MTLTEIRITPGVFLRYVLSGGTVIVGVILCAIALHNPLAIDWQVYLLPAYTYSGSVWNVLLLPAGTALTVIGIFWFAAEYIIETGWLAAEYITEHRRRKTNPAVVHRPHFTFELLTPDTTICTSVNAHTFMVVETTLDEHHPSVAQEFDLAGARLGSESQGLLVNIKGPVPRDSEQVRVSDTSRGTLTVVYGTMRDVQAELQRQDLLLVAQEKAAAQQRAAARKNARAATNRFRLKR